MIGLLITKHNDVVISSGKCRLAVADSQDYLYFLPLSAAFR